MNKNSGFASTEFRYSISGTVRGQYQQLMRDVMVRAYDKDIRSEQSLGEAPTNEQGYYEIIYSQDKFAYTDKQFADLVLRLYDAQGKLLKQTDVYYNAPTALKIDISLSEQPYKGISEFEQVFATVTAFTGRLPLASLTENTETQDITFLTSKTNLQRDRVEALAMAYRFEAQTKISAVVYYGLLREGVPGNPTFRLLQRISASTYEQLAQQKLDGIMHENIDVLMQALQQAVNDNIIPFSISAEFEKIKQELLGIMTGYAQEHPQTGNVSPLFQKIQIAGLSEKDAQQVMEMLAQHQGSIQSFFSGLTAIDTLSEKAGQLNAVFELSNLTNDHLPLIDHLIKTQQIKKAADIRKLAANTKTDWENIITEQKLDTPPSVKGKTVTARIKSFAEKLENNFTKKFPTTAFSARLQQDTESKIEEKDSLTNFFDAHPGFDLQHHRIEAFLSENPKAVSEKEKPVVAGQLRRMQRVFKLAPTYEATHALMRKGIHSSQQVYAMGQDRFMKTFSPELGKKEAKRIFSNASKMYAATVAVAGNMHGLATASKLNVLPNYQEIMKASPAAKEIPNLDVLFQHADFCECDECRSVYGAASYLTDALHFLSQRKTVPPSTDSVRDRLLERRPDIGDIDLNCDNTNTQVPYIDITNEILEEAIVPTVFSIAITFNANLPAFVPLVNTDPLPDKQYPIDGILLNELTTHTADIPHIDLLLTAAAKVSDAYHAMGSSINQWIIRDKFLVLKLTENAGDISVQLLHQTLLTTDELSANPEYTNVKVYDNFLKTAQRPFGLPFDLFNTEANIYLTKLGISKADLIRLFAKENLAVTNPPSNELEEAYAYLDVSFEERNLIFTEDLLNQANYWGTLSASPSVEADLFLQYTGLEYADLMTLLTLQFINPLLDSKIDHDDLSCDLDKQHITNVSAEKFDHIHRFLRLWKKTSFTLQELDACIQCPATGNGKIDPNFAWQLHHFLQIKNRLDLEVFPLLAFYEDIQSIGDDNLYNNLFQNKQITYPLNPDFALANVNSGAAITEIHKAIIQAATFIFADDLNVLLTDNSITTLSLANLSLIYRNGLLMQSQSFTANDLRIAKQVIPVDVFASPADTMDFLSKNDLLNNAGISVWELNYILRQQNDLNQTLIPSDAAITTNLGALQDALLLIQANTSVLPDANGDLLTKWLNDPLLKWDATISAKLINILKTIDDDAYTNNIIPANYTFLKNLRVQFDQPFHETTLSCFKPGRNLVAVELKH